MRLRNVFALAGIAGLLGVPVAAASQSGNPVVEEASGGIHWTIPLPNVFGVEVVSQPLAFDALKYADGSVGGHFEYTQQAGGDTVSFSVDVTCLNVYGGNRAKIGGIVTRSTDPTIAVGMYGWFQTLDSGEGANAPPDWSSLVGFGDEAANEAFCNSPNLPRFGPWDVQGNVQVRTS
jgi:hypothetical protein